MRCLVTGCAGFIGSTLSEALIKKGHEVTGIDCFTGYYSKELKESNISHLLENSDFTFLEKDIVNGLEVDADVVFHLAAQPGVRMSWGRDFDLYVRNNILATQRLLEACQDVKKFVFASSSSVYGNVQTPFREDQDLAPLSPYGISKLSCEQLCKAYSGKFDIAVLRLFTVYGPRQRPDMAFNKFIRAALSGEEITIYGDGSQVRDFTYVDDVVEGLINSASARGFEIFNIGNSHSFALSEVLEMLESIVGKLRISYKEGMKGDMNKTIADISKAQRMIGYKPRTGLKDGLKKEVAWMKNILDL